VAGGPRWQAALRFVPNVERVIVKTLEQRRGTATQWSTRSMAAATGMSQSAVGRIWRRPGGRRPRPAAGAVDTALLKRIGAWLAAAVVTALVGAALRA